MPKLTKVDHKESLVISLLAIHLLKKALSLHLQRAQINLYDTFEEHEMFLPSNADKGFYQKLVLFCFWGVGFWFLVMTKIS